jgi:hypothetical protein
MRAFSISDCRLSIARTRLVVRLALCTLSFGLCTCVLAQSYFNARGLGEITPAGEARIAGLAEPSALSTLNPGIFVGLNQTST